MEQLLFVQVERYELLAGLKSACHLPVLTTLGLDVVT